MTDEVARPFESIESAQEFMALLEETIGEAAAELEQMLRGAEGERQAEALTLALYKMHQLTVHAQKSRRILNDLRLIRGILVVRES